MDLAINFFHHSKQILPGDEVAKAPTIPWGARLFKRPWLFSSLEARILGMRENTSTKLENERVIISVIKNKTDGNISARHSRGFVDEEIYERCV
jgi:hypothetical protein